MVKQKHNEEWCQRIMEWQKDPEFIRAAHEFIRITTGRRNRRGASPASYRQPELRLPKQKEIA